METTITRAAPERAVTKNLIDDVLEVMGKLPDGPTLLEVRGHKQTVDFIRDRFTIPSTLPGIRDGLWGHPIYEVEYLYPGFLEMVMSDGSAKIVSLTRKDRP